MQGNVSAFIWISDSRFRLPKEHYEVHGIAPRIPGNLTEDLVAPNLTQTNDTFYKSRYDKQSTNKSRVSNISYSVRCYRVFVKCK